MSEAPNKRQNLITFLLLLPGLASFFGLFFYPMLVTLARSFHPEGQAVGWTLENYAVLVRDSDFTQVILLTFFLAISSTVLSIALSVPLALLLRRKPAGHRLLRMTILVPITVPGLIGALGLLLFWGSRGWFNLTFMPLLGRTTPIQVNYTLIGLVIFYVWHYFSYTATTTLSTLEGLDPAFEEAATVAGATPRQVLRHVVIPLIMPGILSGSVLSFMAAFGAFSIPLVTGGALRPLAVSIYKQIDVYTPARWSAASAMAAVMAILQVIFLVIYMRLLRRQST
jgi:putative spermidine/putrescine transport system permease protein